MLGPRLVAATDKSVSSRPSILQRSLLARADAGFEPPDVVSVVWIRWIRESINALLPVAGVGGDIASAPARPSARRPWPAGRGQHCRRHDSRSGDTAGLCHSRSDVAGEPVERTRRASRWPGRYRRASGAFVAAIATFVLVQHRRMFVVFAKLARRLTPEKWLSGFTGSASAIDDAVVATYVGGFALLRAGLLRLVGWTAGAGEIWLVMHFLMRAS